MSDSPTPSAAVVIPCWNAERWVARATASALLQTPRNPEIVVVDDGSTDNSVNILKKQFGTSITILESVHLGACAARNIGLSFIKSPYVLFLDADDWLEGPSFLSRLVDEIGRQSWDIIFGRSRSERDGKIISTHQLPEGADERGILREYLEGRYVQTGAVLWRTSFLKDLGGWNVSVLRSQDIELVLRALLRGGRAGTSRSGFVNWHQHNGKERVGHRTGEAVVRSEIGFHDALQSYFGDVNFPLLSHAMGRRYYNLAAEAYYCGALSLGDHALAEARRLGFDAHNERGAANWIAAVLGVRGLQYIRRGLHRIGLRQVPN
jgi:glycosyltransferase involved in cell wall biosynthesis